MSMCSVCVRMYVYVHIHFSNPLRPPLSAGQGTSIHPQHTLMATPLGDRLKQRTGATGGRGSKCLHTCIQILKMQLLADAVKKYACMYVRMYVCMQT